MALVSSRLQQPTDHDDEIMAINRDHEIEMLLSEKLMQGYTLLEKSCPNCTTPLVKNNSLMSALNSTSDPLGQLQQQQQQQQEHMVLVPSKSFEQPFQPVYGVPYCVLCCSHVITNDSDVDLLERCENLKDKGSILVALQNAPSLETSDCHSSAIEESLARISSRVHGSQPPERTTPVEEEGFEHDLEQHNIMMARHQQKYATTTSSVLSAESDTADSTTLGDTTLGTETLASTNSTEDDKGGESAMMQEYSVRREIATKVLGAKMLQGYTLQEEQCSKCGMPTMLSPSDESKCVVCPVLVRKAKKKLKEEERWATEAKAKAEEEDRIAEEARQRLLKEQEAERQEETRKQEEEFAKQRAEQERLERIRKEEEGRLQQIRRAEEERLDTLRREEEERLENLRREQETLLDTKRQQEQERLQKLREEEEARLEALRREEEAMLEAQRREEEERLEALREAERQALEQAKRLEEAKALEAKLVEEARRNEELRLVELARREEEARIAEQEAEAARIQYETKMAEEAKKQDEIRKAQERAIMEETKRLEMMEQERLMAMTRNMEQQFKAGEALRELGAAQKAHEQMVLDSQREAEIYAAEQARKEAEAMALREAETRKIQQEASLISQLETEAEEKAKAAEEAITKAQVALEEVESAKKQIYAQTIAQAEADAVAEAEAIVKSQAEEFKDPNSVEHTQAYVEEQRWETLRAEGRVIMTRRMMEGWTLLADLCLGEKCRHSPLVTKDYKVECVVCGGSGNGKDGVYAGISSRMKEQSLQEDETAAIVPMPEGYLKDTAKADEVARILSPTNIKSVEELKKDFEEKRNQVSKEIGAKMLQGWTLLDMPCPRCVMPLMSDGEGGPETCVLCGPVYMFDDSFAKPAPSKPIEKPAPTLLGKLTVSAARSPTEESALTFPRASSPALLPSAVERAPSPLVAVLLSSTREPDDSTPRGAEPGAHVSTFRSNDPSSGWPIDVPMEEQSIGLEPDFNATGTRIDSARLEPDASSTDVGIHDIPRTQSMDPAGSSLRNPTDDIHSRTQLPKNDPPEPSFEQSDDHETQTGISAVIAAGSQARSDPPIDDDQDGQSQRLQIEPSPSLGGVSIGEATAKSVDPSERGVSIANPYQSQDLEGAAEEDEARVEQEPEVLRHNNDPAERTGGVSVDPDDFDEPSRVSNDPPEDDMTQSRPSPAALTSSEGNDKVTPLVSVAQQDEADDVELDLPPGYYLNEESSVRELMSVMKAANLEEERMKREAEERSGHLSAFLSSSEENMTSALANGTAVIRAQAVVADELSNITGFTASIRQPRPEVSPTKKSYSGLTLVSEMSFDRPESAVQPTEFVFDSIADEQHALPFVPEEERPREFFRPSSIFSELNDDGSGGGIYRPGSFTSSDVVTEKPVELTLPRSLASPSEQRSREDRFSSEKPEERKATAYRSDPLSPPTGSRHARPPSPSDAAAYSPRRRSLEKPLAVDTEPERSPFARRRYEEFKSPTKTMAGPTPVSAESSALSTSGIPKRGLPPRPSSSPREPYRLSPDYSPARIGSGRNRSRSRSRTRSNSPARRTPPRPESSMSGGGGSGSRSVSGYSPLRSRSPRPMIPPSHRVQIVGGPMGGGIGSGGGRQGEDMSIVSGGSRAETVASEALDVILNKIEDCKSSLVSDIASGRDVQKQTEMAALIEKLASAAVTLKKLEDL